MRHCHNKQCLPDMPSGSNWDGRLMRSRPVSHTHNTCRREREREIYIYIHIIWLYDMCIRTLNKRRLFFLGRWILGIPTAAVSQLQLCPRIIELVFERPGSLGLGCRQPNHRAGCIPEMGSGEFKRFKKENIPFFFLGGNDRNWYDMCNIYIYLFIYNPVSDGLWSIY